MSLDEKKLMKQIEDLKPWRYNHFNGDYHIKSYSDSSHDFDVQGRKIISELVDKLLIGKDPSEMRVIDLGCLEGHHSEVFCSKGFKEVVSIDLSEGHVARAKFLLQVFHGYKNSTVLQGNVTDADLMKGLGKFDIVFFHGLLYHLKDPLKMFDIIEGFIPCEDRDFSLLLSTQYFISYSSLLNPEPVAELRVKPLELRGGLMIGSDDGSVFERYSMRLNPACVYNVLKLYGFDMVVSYDTPGGFSHSFNSNLVALKNRQDFLLSELNNIDVPGFCFREWRGGSVNSFDFSSGVGNRFLVLLLKVFKGFFDLVGKFKKLNSSKRVKE